MTAEEFHNKRINLYSALRQSEGKQADMISKMIDNLEIEYYSEERY